MRVLGWQDWASFLCVDQQRRLCEAQGLVSRWSYEALFFCSKKSECFNCPPSPANPAVT